MAAKKVPTDTGTTSRCFKKDVTVQLGPIGFAVNFYPPKRSTQDAKFESLCPTCLSDAKTQYYCIEHDDHGPFASDEIVRRQVNTEVITTAAEVAAVKAEENSDAFNLFAYPADDIERNTFAVGTPYVMRPVPGTPAPLYPTLLAKIGRDGRINGGDQEVALTLVGEVVLKGNKKLMQLRSWKGHLVAQELARPEDTHAFEDLDLVPDERFDSFVDDSIELATEEFDPDAFENQARKRLAEWAEAKADAGEDGVVVPIIREAKPAVNQEDAMLAQLEASIAVAKAAKAKAS